MSVVIEGDRERIAQLRSSRFPTHGVKRPTGLFQILNRLRRHIARHGEFKTRGEIREFVRAGFRAYRYEGEADDFVRYLFNRGIFREEDGGVACSKRRLKAAVWYMQRFG